LGRYVLYQLEKEFEKTLDWDRNEIKKRATQIVTQGYFPPEEYVIQGLMPAPRSNSPRNSGCRGCEFHRPFAPQDKRCYLKALKGIVHKGYCPKKFIKVERKIVPDKVRGGFIAIKQYHYTIQPSLSQALCSLCSFCDFFNKIDKFCALQAIGRKCIYNVKAPRKAPRETLKPNMVKMV